MASGYLLCAKIYYSCRMFLLGKVWCSSYDSIFGQMPVSRQPVRASCCAGMIEENSQEKASCQTAAVGRIVDSFIYNALHDHQNDHQDQAAHIIFPETAAVAQSDIEDRAYVTILASSAPEAPADTVYLPERTLSARERRLPQSPPAR